MKPRWTKADQQAVERAERWLASTYAFIAASDVHNLKRLLAIIAKQRRFIEGLHEVGA